MLNDFKFDKALEWISAIVVQPCFLILANLPLVIALGISNLDKNIIFIPHVKWPKQGLKLIISFLLYNVGVIISFFFWNDSTSFFRISYFLISMIFVIPMFTLAPLLIAIFLETFKSFCENSKDGNNKKLLIQGYIAFKNTK